MVNTLCLYRPGLIDYQEAWLWQRQTADAVRAGAAEHLAVLQHPPVYSFGCKVRRENLLADPETLAQLGAAVVESDRGGDVTFHGPGQLVAYPILNLRRRGIGAADYVRLLEATMIRAVSRFGIAAERWPGRPGVWTHRAKLGAVGLRVQGGVSTHGLALNVDLDLSWFDPIVPCGLRDIETTSLERLLGYSPGIDAVEQALLDAFEYVFDSRLTPSHQPARGYTWQSPLKGSLSDFPSEIPLLADGTERGTGVQPLTGSLRGHPSEIPLLLGRSRQVVPGRTQDAQSHSPEGAVGR